MMISAKATERLLRSISSRLSSREDCKKVNYKVTIDGKGIWMEPLVQVYPDCHHRKESDKMSIVSYVYNKMNNIKLDELVSGHYEYQLSADGRNRRWRKID